MPTELSELEVFKRSFRLRLLQSRLRRERPVIQGDRGQALETARRAWKARDYLTFIPLARELRRAAPVGTELALRLATALLGVGLFGEAVAALSDAADRPDQADAGRELLLAKGRLGLGALEAAGEALCAGSAIGWSEHQRGEAELLAAILAAAAGPGALPPWAELDRLIAASVELGLVDAATLALARFVAAGPVKSGKACTWVLETAIALLQTGARSEPAKALFDAMAALYETAGAGELHRATGSAIAAEGQASPAGLPDSPPPGPALLWDYLGQTCAALGKWEAAAARLPVTPRSKGVLAETMQAMGWCIGRQLLSAHPLRFRPDAAGPRKVFCVSPFYNEFTQLEMKLEEMSGWVDHFVIVEATQTHAGRPKPLFFQDQRGRFDRFADRIVHIVVEAFPAYMTASWQREMFQRDHAVLGLSGLCAPDDLVVICDMDELVRREALEPALDHDLAGGEVRTFMYFFNNEQVFARPKIKPVFARAGLLAEFGCSYLRMGAGRFLKHQTVADAGWHFTSIAEPAGLHNKAQSSAHTEHAHLGQGYFEDLVARIRAGAADPRFVRRELDDDLPAYLARNRDRLSALLL